MAAKEEFIEIFLENVHREGDGDVGKRGIH